jgi:hypothetical protein
MIVRVAVIAAAFSTVVNFAGAAPKFHAMQNCDNDVWLNVWMKPTETFGLARRIAKRNILMIHPAITIVGINAAKYTMV